MNHPLQEALRAGVAQGLLPEGVTPSVQDTRPWPVTLLTALGAWLAAVPLLAFIGLLLGDTLMKGAAPYFVGALVLVGASVVMRSRELPVFIEQLAFPGLLVGFSLLAYALYRDLPNQFASVLLLPVALALIWVLQRAWLRTLLGSAALLLFAAAWLPEHVFKSGGFPAFALWAGLHVALVLWALVVIVQRQVALPTPQLAAAAESAGAGWLVMLLVCLCWWSGMTFLAGGALGESFRGASDHQLGASAAGPLWALMQAGSALLALAAAAYVARIWPRLRDLRAAAVAIVLAALCWFLPALGGTLLAAALTVTSGRARLAMVSGLACAWIVGSFYYQLHWPLADKALVLVVAGALLGVLAWPATVLARPAKPHPMPEHKGPRAFMALAAVAVLGVANFAIWQKETLIATGAKVFVELAPVDPRSLMQGDYMQLNWRLPSDTDAVLSRRVSLHRPHVIARRDARGVAQLLRVATHDTSLAPGEMRIELTPKDSRWLVVTDAWFFSEGDAQRWTGARYGDFRVAPSGQALLVGLADAQLRPIASPR